MTVIRSYQPYVNNKTCKTGVPVMAGILNQMMASTTQLDKVKVLNRTHVTTLYNYVDYGGNSVESDITGFNFSSTDPLYVFVPTSPEVSHIALIIKYYTVVTDIKSLQSSQLTVQAFDSAGSSIDIGMDFKWGEHLTFEGAGLFTLNTVEAFTGTEQYEPPSGGYLSRTTPRPIYVPSANRGNNIYIKFTNPYIVIAGVDILELVP